MKFQARVMGAEIKDDEDDVENKDESITENEISDDMKLRFEKMVHEKLEKQGLKQWQN